MVDARLEAERIGKYVGLDKVELLYAGDQDGHAILFLHAGQKAWQALQEWGSKEILLSADFEQDEETGDYLPTLHAQITVNIPGGDWYIDCEYPSSGNKAQPEEPFKRLVKKVTRVRKMNVFACCCGDADGHLIKFVFSQEKPLQESLDSELKRLKLMKRYIA